MLPLNAKPLLGVVKSGATGCEFDYRFDLFTIEPFKPLQNIVYAGACLEVFKNGGHRHAGASQYPGSTYLSRNAFHRRAF
jgi:hypothetical protein